MVSSFPTALALSDTAVRQSTSSRILIQPHVVAFRWSSFSNMIGYRPFWPWSLPRSQTQRPPWYQRASTRKFWWLIGGWSPSSRNSLPSLGRVVGSAEANRYDIVAALDLPFT